MVNPTNRPSNSVESNGVNGTETQSPAASDQLKVDVLIVGGGFGGMYALYLLRKLGITVKVFEAGSDFGGTWHWNQYPGARSDSEVPYYGLSIPEVHKTWTWSERFPDSDELRRYFKHVDKTLDLSKDAVFSTIVTEAKYVNEEWQVKTEKGSTAVASYLILATGSSYKVHIPDFKNLDSFKGKLIHSALYPKDGVDFTSKKVGVVGSGASGVQLIQAIAPQDCELTAFIRTPNTALPMSQRKISKEEQDNAKCFYQAMFRAARASRGGFPYNANTTSFFEHTPEQRQRYLTEIFQRGGFYFLNANYPEFISDRDINREIYEFWAKSVRSRVKNPIKRDIVAPLKQKHWFGTKRPSLEQNYYEMIDRDNVKVVDIGADPIDQFEARGIRTKDGKLHELDIIILATGFDALTGSLKNINLFDTDGIPLAEKWANGTYTHLGLTIDKMPNLFLVYSPQAPTPLSNGPTIIELQVEWVVAAITKMRQEGIKSITAQFQASQRWREEVQKTTEHTLYPETDSWYTGANIPGKPREQLIYLGGVDVYDRVIHDSLKGWTGFDVVKA